MSVRLYVSGPMTGYPNGNVPQFREAAEQLRTAGFTVENPAEYPTPTSWTWEDYLRRDLQVVLAVDGIATLADVYLSRGARLEIHVANELGLPVLPVQVWLTQAEEKKIVRLRDLV